MVARRTPHGNVALWVRHRLASSCVSLERAHSGCDLAFASPRPRRAGVAVPRRARARPAASATRPDRRSVGPGRHAEPRRTVARFEAAARPGASRSGGPGRHRAGGEQLPAGRSASARRPGRPYHAGMTSGAAGGSGPHPRGGPGRRGAARTTATGLLAGREPGARSSRRSRGTPPRRGTAGYGPPGAGPPRSR